MYNVFYFKAYQEVTFLRSFGYPVAGDIISVLHR